MFESMRNVAPPFTLHNEIHLYEESSAKDVCSVWTEFNGEVVLRNVVVPTLIPFSPTNESTNRNEAVLIGPGGGLMILALSSEGIDVAKKLSEHGYTAYVLKYRLNPTEILAEGFERQCKAFYEEKMSNGFGRADVYLDADLAIEDLIKSISVIEKNESAFKKLHYLGFSAGAKIGLDSLTHPKYGNEFDSLGLMYFSLERTSKALKSCPPLFASLANDDPLFSKCGFGLLEQWSELGQDVEFHLFKNGGHGFAGKPTGATSDCWLDLYLNWLKQVESSYGE